MLERNIKGLYFPYLIINLKTDEFLGFMDVKNIDYTIPKGELGYFLDEKNIGKGIAVRALTKMTEHFFEKLDFVKLFLRTSLDHIASKQLAEKWGFEVEGILRKDYKITNGDIVDLLYYGKLQN